MLPTNKLFTRKQYLNKECSQADKRMEKPKEIPGVIPYSAIKDMSDTVDEAARTIEEQEIIIQTQQRKINQYLKLIAVMEKEIKELKGEKK